MGRRFTKRAVSAVFAGPMSFPCGGPGYRSSKVGTQNPVLPGVPLKGVPGLSSKESSLFRSGLEKGSLRAWAFGAEPLLGCQVSWYYFQERWKRSSRLETRAKEFRAGASSRACTNPKGGMKVNVLRAAGLVLDIPGLEMTDPATRSRPHARGSEMEHQL